MKTASKLLSIRMAVCYVLYHKESANGREIKTAIEDHVDEHIGDPRLYPVLDDLEDSGLITRDHLNATHDRFQLAEEGEALLLEHHGWFSRCVDDSTGQQTFSK